MVFSSPVFLFLFLPIVLAVYFILPRFLRNSWLLVMSLLFYVWGERGYTVLMLASMVMNYFFGLLVDRFRGKRNVERVVLAASLIVNLGLLIAFKYANFLVNSVNPLLAALHRHHHFRHIHAIHLAPVHLPIGISFFTFHAISYVVDVHRGHARVQKNPFNFALYESLFPQLVAGPIVRYQDVADMIDHRRESVREFAYGIRRFIVGLSKKVLIANTLAQTADKIFGIQPTHLHGTTAWLGIVCYTLQIYFDFSGYSDMAIGLGHMFGFTFMENFNYPYISRSIKEFWRRWHISLSTWFRDYLYIPLGGNRVSAGRSYFNLVVVFFLCGLWHGASWNFVIWGLLHGFFLVLERQKFMDAMEKIGRPLQHFYTLLIVIIGWVFFRADTLPEALSYLGAMFGFHHAKGPAPLAALYLDRMTLAALIAGIIGSTPIALKLVKPAAPRREPDVASDGALLGLLRIGALAGLFALCAIQLAANTYNPFIYFRF